MKSVESSPIKRVLNGRVPRPRLRWFIIGVIFGFALLIFAIWLSGSVEAALGGGISIDLQVTTTVENHVTF